MALAIATGKPTVFISYSSLDSVAAARLRSRLEKLTAGEVDFFLAGDDESIPIGVNWVKRIEEKLRRAKAVIVLLSHAAVTSQWVLFEMGFAYAKQVPVIPVGILGLEVNYQPPPISLLQGINVADAMGLNHMLEQLGKHLRRTFAATFADKDYDKIFGDAPVQTSPIRTFRLPSRPEIYAEGTKLVRHCDINSHVRATVAVFDPDDMKDKYFHEYIDTIAEKCGHAAKVGARFTYHVVFGFRRTKSGKIPSALHKAIEQRLRVFRAAGAEARLNMFEVPEQWTLNMLFINREHAILGFPEDATDPQLQYGMRLSGADLVTPLVEWYDKCIEGRAQPLRIEVRRSRRRRSASIIAKA
jgi:hypothetical protein